MSRNTDEYDVCTLLSFWVYSRLFDVFKNKGEKKVNIVYGDLQRIWNEFIDHKLKKSENETCRPISEIVLYEDWRKTKDLYEYYLDYYPFYKTLAGYSQRCPEFYKYIESKNTVYDHFENRCPNDNTNVCPKFYNDSIKYNPKNVLQDLSCHNQILQERAADTSRGPQIGNGHSVSETESRGRSVDMNTVDASQNLSRKPKTVENVGNILLGVVATTMTSGALYRFTPLGGMIRNVLGWNNNNMGNFNGGDIRLYDYASEPFNPYSGAGEEHYIGYHPA
ncbi:Plasmodium vivax Vir protein, putative [Plasmodium vivax]|uniref:Vir protein, putative n=1 Tax=Plasmodium vivax TaxID=5855 RepID=A0A1G4H7V5_PLAVI|nr:Plasmodium vivax Vir protein, putative [Plasmodium vivax]